MVGIKNAAIYFPIQCESFTGHTVTEYVLDINLWNFCPIVYTVIIHIGKCT